MDGVRHAPNDSSEDPLHPTIGRFLRARWVLTNWFTNEPKMASIIEDPVNQKAIVEAAGQLVNDETRERFIAYVQGDGSNSERVTLAKNCRELATLRYQR